MVVLGSQICPIILTEKKLLGCLAVIILLIMDVYIWPMVSDHHIFSPHLCS